MDLSPELTDDELKAELDGMRLALEATLGRPYDGREEHKNADLRSKIIALRDRTGQAAQCQLALKVKRPADVIGNAVKVMRIATGEEAEDYGHEDGKDPGGERVRKERRRC